MGFVEMLRKWRKDPRTARASKGAWTHLNDEKARERVRQLKVSRRNVRFLADGSRVIRRRPRHAGLPICAAPARGKGVTACR